jgi:phosphoglycerate dehydrogenase-like enzyme
VNVGRPKILLVCNQEHRERYAIQSELDRLLRFADLDWLECNVAGFNWVSILDDPTAEARVIARVEDVDALVTSAGSPRISAAVIAAAPKLRFIGEMTGDRFGARIDTDAAFARGIRVVDTTNGSSYPVAEWALALTLIALRDAGKHFRAMIGPDVHAVPNPREDLGWQRGELTGKKVGLLGCGIIGRRLLQLLAPFHCDVRVDDPYLPKEVADIFGFLLTSLDYVLSESEVVICLAPLTPKTRRMIGERELDLLPPGSALVNVSRGAIIDSDALVERLRRGDITGAFDVFDPEPIPAGHAIRSLPNVFLTPHIASFSAANGPRFFRLMVDELDRWFHGHETLFDLTPRTLANRRGEPWPREQG